MSQESRICDMLKAWRSTPAPSESSRRVRIHGTRDESCFVPCHPKAGTVSQEVPMKQLLLSLLAICVGIAALALSWTPRAGTDAADRAEILRLSNGLAEAQIRFDHLEARLDRIEAAATSRAQPTSPVAGKRFDELEENARLAERVARLEQVIARLADVKDRPSQPETREASPPTLSDTELAKAITMWTDMARN